MSLCCMLVESGMLQQQRQETVSGEEWNVVSAGGARMKLFRVLAADS